jgi:hypothetical protein
MPQRLTYRRAKLKLSLLVFNAAFGTIAADNRDAQASAWPAFRILADVSHATLAIG